MALTLHSNYSNALGNEILENWLFLFYYVDSPSSTNTSFLGLSYKDITITHDAGGSSVSQAFSGVVLNTATIRQSWNPATSKVTTSNLSVDIANFTHSSNPVSEELFGGSNKYINRAVRIYSVVGTSTRLDQSLQIFEGTLESITHNVDKLSLQLLSARPFDGIEIPNKVSNRGKFFPVVYGNYTPETSTNSSAQEILSAVVYPAPVDEISGSKFNVLVHDNISGDRTVHYHETNGSTANKELFAPLEDIPSATIASGDAHKVQTNIDLDRTFIARPLAVINEEDFSDFTNTSNMIDGDVSTSGGLAEESVANSSGDLTTSTSVSVTKKLNFELPKFDHELTELKTRFRVGLSAVDTTIDASADSLSYSIVLTDLTSTDDDTIVTFSGTQSRSGSGAENATTSAVSTATYTEVKTIGDQIPDKIELQVTVNLENTTTADAGNVLITNFLLSIFEVTFIARCKIPTSTSASNKGIASNEALKNIEKFYIGADGFSQGYSGGSGVCNTPSEIIRDAVDRFADFDNTDSTSFTTMNNDRADFEMRVWLTEQVSLKAFLDKLAYEGCCPYYIRGDGKLGFVHVADSPSTAHTLDKNDFTSINISHTTPSELITGVRVYSNRSPVDNRHLTFTSNILNSTPRTNYFGGSSIKNIRQIKLDYLVDAIGSAFGGNTNDDFIDYYGKFYGDVKTKITCEVINPAFYSMELGDIVAFNNSAMPVNAFATAWTSLKFTITSLSRSVGKLNIELLEL
tara:strand:- start:802 stop:3039 length:2238 start_codon:yes stop_codon:yes gene_type:complete